jgi:DNA polymerase III delta prime subunit
MKPKERLSRIVESGKVPHALLFTGPRGAGKKEAARQFAADLLQMKIHNHPDVHLYSPEGKAGLHPIESIREISQNVALAPYTGKWRIFIIDEAEKMLPTSSNAILKTLEEPTPNTVIILISHYPDRLLPTILSRCQNIEFPPQKAPVDTDILNILCGTTPKEKLTAFESEQPDVVFETILFWHRDRLLLEIGGSEELLHFPEHREIIQKIPLIPFEFVEKQIALAALAHNRSTKLSTCLEMLFLSLMD